MSSRTESADGRPESVVDLEKVYGIASQNAFGSSVFYDPASNLEESLEEAALAKYQYFAGETWDRYGEENWLGEWSPVYERSASTKRDIVAELRKIADNSARLSASLLLENNENEAEACKSLASVFDDQSVSELSVFKIGDGSAMSGVLIASRRSTDETVFLVLLMD